MKKRKKPMSTNGAEAKTRGVKLRHKPGDWPKYSQYSLSEISPDAFSSLTIKFTASFSFNASDY